MEYLAFMFKDENSGEYVAVVPDIRGCIAYEDTLEELHEMIEDFVELSLEDEELPPANSAEYFSDKVLNDLSIPLTCSKHTLKVEEEDSKSYSVEIL